MSEVIAQQVFDDGMLCCGRKAIVETIDTGRQWMARYEYRVVCRTCGSKTTQCTWKLGAKTIWNNPRDRVKEVINE